MQSDRRPLPLSACVITKNEERNLGACLAALGFCDEVVIVDSGSTDRTLVIAREAGARVIEAEWPGMVEQKNRAVAAARHAWVLCVDADERVSPKLEDSIRKAFAGGEPAGVAGFRMAWRTVYLGRPVHSDRGRGRWKLRLFDRRRGRWVGAEPHGHVEVDGSTRRLAGPLHHHTVRDLAHHVEKMNPYTDAAAEELLAAGKGVYLGLLVRPPAAFLRSFVVRGGFLDGVRGFVVAWMAAAYVFLKYAKLAERRRAGVNPLDPPPPAR